MTTPPDILEYESHLEPDDRALCEALREHIERSLPVATSKVWHAHPVWFLSGNPIVGYSRLKWGVRLLFWSGKSFEESGLSNEWKFMAAEKRYTHVSEVDTTELTRWLSKSRDIQWDYANIVKRQWKLERLK
jgi:hypothetical protein